MIPCPLGLLSKGFQGSRIVVPHADRLRPKREFLEERFELFKRAA
jgi:hypothetical protein